MTAGAVAVIIPTRNEAGNIGELLDRLFALERPVRVWVLDDDSSDGTVAEVERRMAPGRGLTLVRRSGERGYGRASLEGLRLAAASGAALVCQMDGDLSHDPAYLPALLAAAGDADLVLGSRYLGGISVVHWSLRRLLLSIGANAYVRTLLRLGVSDCTTGYRLWRAELLGRLHLEEVRSEGYAFLVETLFRARRSGARVAEVPIVFVERKSGESKLSLRVVAESALLPWRLLLRRAVGR